MLRAVPLLLLVLASPLLAGGGPETTLLVVNGRSPTSRWIANEYARLRAIPPTHLVVLDTVPHDGVIPLSVFRESIWKPIVEHMEREGLTDVIDLVAYSAGFPYGVDFRNEYGERRPTQDIGGTAALTGVTYLIRQVEAGEEWWSWKRESNRYFRIGRASARKLTGDETRLATDAQALHKRGQLRQARKKYEAFLDAAPEFGRMWVMYAACLADLREIDEAFRALNQAAARGFKQIGLLESLPAFARMRADPRWKTTLEGMARALSGLRPTVAFAAAKAWDEDGEPVDDAESMHRYVLSVQLAHTGFKGNSVPEVLAYLRAAAGADATRPDGTVYVCKNGNVRSTAREQFFGPLLSALQARGRKAELLDKTTVPPKKSDVLGAVVGTAGFNWKSSGSTILPGAICDHLTSFGAHFGTAGQTKLTEFLRYGAAGASGTVMEPLAIHLKFPNPLIHAFYADGCSLAEAFYQSVAAPYQLMIVGDPLCQPFANPPAFELPVPGRPWKGTVAFAPQGDADFEYWLDGKRIAVGPTCEWDASKPWHDFRVVAVGKGRIAARSSKRFERALDPVSVKYGEPIALPRGTSVEAYYGGRRVDDGAGGKHRVPSERVGPGPVRLLVREHGDARVLDVDVTLPAPAPAVERAEPRLGALASIDGGDEFIVTTMATRPAGMLLREQMGRKMGKLKLSGAVLAPAEGAYRFAATGSPFVVEGEDGLGVFRASGDPAGDALLVLAKGWHAFEAELAFAKDIDLQLTVAGAQPGAAPRLGRVLPDFPEPEVEPANEGGFRLSWKRAPKRKLAALGVFPAKDQDLGEKWVVETRRTKNGKWKPVQHLRVLLAPSPTRPPKGKKSKPVAAELVFDPVKTRYVRVAPEGQAKLEGVVVSRDAK